MKFMRTLLLFTFVFIFVNEFSYSQQNPTSIDSLPYYYQLALKPKKPEDFTKSYDYFLTHKNLCLTQNNIEGAIYDLRLLAIILFESGFYNDSENTVVEGLKLLDKSKNDDYKINAHIGFYNQLGRISEVRKEYDTAIKHYNVVLDLTSNLSEKASALNNLGLVYREKKDLIKSENIFKEGYDNALISGDSARIATLLDNLGYIKFKNDNSLGFDEIQQALNIRLRNNFFQKTFPSYTHLSDYFLAQSDTIKAKEYLNKAKEVAESLNSESYQLEVLKKMLLLEASSIGSEYVDLNQQKTNRQQLLENKFAARKYNYVEQEKIAIENKRQKELLLIILLVISVIGILLFIIIRIKHKKAKLQEIYNTEFRLSKRIHDEVSNDVYQIMVQLESGTKDSVVIDALDKIYSKTRDISRENRVISINENFKETLLDLITSFKNDNINIVTKGISSVDWDKYDSLKKITLYRVIQELLTNMRKHSKANLVALVFEVNSKKLIINYSDNGVGTLLNSKNGLLNTENRMESIGGKITFESQPTNGFKAKILLK